MKNLEQLTMLMKIGSSMVKEVKESEALKKAKADLKEDTNTLTSTQVPRNLLKDLVELHKIRKQLINEMLNSDEADFIKTAIKESDKGKKVSQSLETIKDMIPEKVKIEYINYKHWCINWAAMGKMGLEAPLPVIKGVLKYTWIFDLAKANAMATMYVENRSGANVEQSQEQITFIVKQMCSMLKHALSNPDKVVLNENMVPSEIFQAMGLHNIVPELPGAMLPKLDQYAGVRYLDAAESHGLPADTCGLPRFTTGVALTKEMPQARCVVASNLPCDGGSSSYEMVQQSIGNAPIYRLNVPYDFRNDESIDTFADDLEGLVKFLEENTDGKMDWDELRRVCSNYNEMVDMELERWEMIKTSTPPLTNDAIWFPHYWNFNVTAGSDETVKIYKKLTKLAKQAYEKGQPSFPNMRYRTLIWNPPPSGYGHLWNWMERCWGIGAIMDMETYGQLQHVDTSTPRSMLRGLGRRYMWGTMAKHTRGPAVNMLEDMLLIIEQFKPDFIMYPAHVGCKNSMAMESTMRDKCKEAGVPFCVFRYELLDNRVVSRQGVRDQISKFMTDVMHAEPLDPSLLTFDDGSQGKW